ncbi:MAG: AtpZ/AtpI family protein [Rhodospirillales bacterium]|nr:MAG: AtpZ/AtpI family protein [Rhodospirillales bacterium]
MGTEDKPPSLDELGERLRAAREHRGTDRRGGKGLSGSPGGMGGLGWALRIGVEMVSALAVGVGIGLLLDWWLGTGPWLLVVFFFLGAGAAILNVYRAAMGYGLAVGYKEPARGKDRGAAKADGDKAARTRPEQD